ncbi:uncharacterized protein si:ch211-250n8.1 isoform X2 [Nerophis ophidion]|uniref:uncharacterized protein si:ch211-250n8.1 isoform X2 n=1 Tax=Nerophis ophidion TaxID=159077 RepID=UPI002AE08B0B|nr:uncharacterized protein si:ch211-250n8.1 isoform X2 [Nerophis ophidion]
MAPRDPLLSALKVCVLNLQSDGESVTDSSPHLVSCCELLELVLRKGLQQPLLNLVHRDYWQCFERLPHQDTCGRLCALSLAVEQTKACKKLLSAQGRGRYLLRLALSRKMLPQFIRHLLHTPKILEVCETYEVVPCREVGMVLSCLGGRVFLVDMIHGRQAHVDNFICRGDIIDEINGTSLRNSKHGQADVVLSRLKGCPLSIRIVRWKVRDGTVYRPLVKLLRTLRMENPWLQLDPVPCQQTAANDQRASKPSHCLIDGRIVYIVQFLGKANIGGNGSKDVIQHAIPQVLQKNLPSKEVLLDLQETHLTCTESSSKLKLCEHHYPNISCVGRYCQPDYTLLAFCVVDTPGSPPNFSCVVLKAASFDMCKEIVCRIATGFKHTEWFV